MYYNMIDWKIQDVGVSKMMDWNFQDRRMEHPKIIDWNIQDVRVVYPSCCNKISKNEWLEHPSL